LSNFSYNDEGDVNVSKRREEKRREEKRREDDSGLNKTTTDAPIQINKKCFNS